MGLSRMPIARTVAFSRWARPNGGAFLVDGGAIVFKETEAEATLENCRALINQITVGLSAEKPFVDFLSAAEVLLYLDFACSALKKSALHPREQKITLH
jgi:hypothetical protein